MHAWPPCRRKKARHEPKDYMASTGNQGKTRRLDYTVSKLGPVKVCRHIKC